MLLELKREHLDVICQCGSQAQPRRLLSLPSHLHARSPFRTTSDLARDYQVVAIEIDWKDVCGLNYHNPLCMDGRLVIEAARLTKRQFTNVRFELQSAPLQPCTLLALNTSRA